MKFRFTSCSPGYRVVSLTLMLTLAITGVIIGGLGELSSRATPGSLSSIAGCPLFPGNNIWNRDISNLPVSANSVNFIASINISSFSPQNRIILTALQHYGMIVADSGSSWYLSGAPDNRWNNDDLHALSTIPGSDFEVVDESALQFNPNSGQALTSSASPGITPAPTKVRTQAPSPISTSRSVSISDPAEETRQRNDSPSVSNDGGAGAYPLLLFGVGGLALFLLLIGVVGQRLIAARRKDKTH